MALFGLPRTGKSTLAKRMASWHVVDSDKAIAAWRNTSIASLILEEGISAFRDVEKQWLEAVAIPEKSEHTRYLLSTGGGMPCNEQALRLLQEHFHTVYLRIPRATWLQRMHDPHQPPHTLSNHYNKKQLESLFDEREPFYTRAHQILEVGSTVSQDARALAKLLDNSF